MLFGPSLIFKCPHCQVLYQQQTLASGNTFGAIFFSDGFFIAPMLPVKTRITSCVSCNNLFWLDRNNHVGSFDYSESVGTEWLDAPEITFPDIQVFIEALNKHMYSDSEQEFYIRKNIWWMLNHRKPLNEADYSRWHPLYKSNVLELLNLLNPEIQEECFTMAELYRNIGEFSKALSLLERIHDKNMASVTSQYADMCRKKIPETFKLK